MSYQGANGYDCTYCGMNATDMDHVIPKVYSQVVGRSREDCVPACRECNSILKDWIVDTIADRAGYVARVLSEKHRSLLASPEWNAYEYEELEGRLLKQVKSLQTKKKVVKARIGYAESVALMAELTIEGVWASQDSQLKKDSKRA